MFIRTMSIDDIQKLLSEPMSMVPHDLNYTYSDDFASELEAEARVAPDGVSVGQDLVIPRAAISGERASRPHVPWYQARSSAPPLPWYQGTCTEAEVEVEEDEGKADGICGAEAPRAFALFLYTRKGRASDWRDWGAVHKVANKQKLNVKEKAGGVLSAEVEYLQSICPLTTLPTAYCQMATGIY